MNFQVVVPTFSCIRNASLEKDYIEHTAYNLQGIDAHFY